jgi:hypothetical protein
MSLFAAIQDSFESFHSSEGFERAFRHWIKGSDALSLLGDPEELIETLHCFRDPLQRTNLVAEATLAALCVRARNRPPPVNGEPPISNGEAVGRPRPSDDAALLILWLFLPQLWGASFVNPGGALDRDDFEGERQDMAPPSRSKTEALPGPSYKRADEIRSESRRTFAVERSQVEGDIGKRLLEAANVLLPKVVDKGPAGSDAVSVTGSPAASGGES